MAQKRYSKKKLAFFKKHIQAKLDALTSDLDNSRDSLGSSKDGSGLSQDSVYSVHMADAGTDSHEQEKNFMLMNRGSDYLKNLEIALERINDGSFGVCKICNELIPAERMMEVPNATKCVNCKEKGKLGLI